MNEVNLITYLTLGHAINIQHYELNNFVKLNLKTEDLK